MIRQIWKVIRLVGLLRAGRMKRHHEMGLKYIRGYAAISCWWTLLNSGFLDELNAHGRLDAADYAKQNGWVPEVFDAIIEYLDGIGLLERRGAMVRLSKAAAALHAEPRGLIELLWAYEPCFGQLDGLLKGQKKYGIDLTRRIEYVGIGSGRLCEQLPYPVMRRIVLAAGCKTVLDLGCGDMAFLGGLCRLDSNISCHGIDCSEEMIQFNRQQLAKNDYNGRLTVQTADMFDLPTDLSTVDCITACDTFHEYLHDEDRLVDLLKRLAERFDGALFVVGEFCLQDAEWLRRHKTASLEHHLFHQLSGQQIGTAAQWREIFGRAGLQLVEEQIYDLIGHGYFAMR